MPMTTGSISDFNILCIIIALYYIVCREWMLDIDFDIFCTIFLSYSFQNEGKIRFGAICIIFDLWNC